METEKRKNQLKKALGNAASKLAVVPSAKLNID